MCCVDALAPRLLGCRQECAMRWEGYLLGISRLCLGGFIAVVAQRKSRGERIISRLIPTLPISPPFSPTALLSAGVSILSLYFLYFGVTNSLFPLLLFRKARPLSTPFSRGTEHQARQEREGDRKRLLWNSQEKLSHARIGTEETYGPISLVLGNTMGAKSKQNSICPLSRH